MNNVNVKAEFHNRLSMLLDIIVCIKLKFNEKN